MASARQAARGAPRGRRRGRSSNAAAVAAARGSNADIYAPCAVAASPRGELAAGTVVSAPQAKPATSAPVQLSSEPPPPGRVRAFAMFAPSMREASPLTSPRAGIAHSWNTAEAALEREAEVIVRSTDAQLASLREAALSLSLERRRDRSALLNSASPNRDCRTAGVAATPRGGPRRQGGPATLGRDAKPRARAAMRRRVARLGGGCGASQPNMRSDPGAATCAPAPTARGALHGRPYCTGSPSLSQRCDPCALCSRVPSSQGRQRRRESSGGAAA
jgi:hypothetical protein